MSAAVAPIVFTLNGTRVAVRVQPMKRLLDVLREDCGLTGTKEGCGEGECGACTVLVDGARRELLPGARSAQAAGATVVTIEGLRRAVTRLQRAFVEHGGAQCGICTPGMIMAAVALGPKPTLERGAHGPGRQHLPLHRLRGHLSRDQGGIDVESQASEASLTDAKAQQGAEDGLGARDGPRATPARDPRRERSDEDRHLAARPAAAALAEGRAAHAPRRGPAHAAGRLHRRLRGPELRHAARPALPQHLGPRRTARHRRRAAACCASAR